MVRWTEAGVTYEADPRHAEIMISELGLKDAKPVAAIEVDPAARGGDEINVIALAIAGVTLFNFLYLVTCSV